MQPTQGNLGDSTERPLRRILVVDDDTAVREGIAKALRREGSGYVVDTARDGFEAGAKLSSFHPDLVLLDVVMPGMSGLEVCHRIRTFSKRERIKIIILTGYPDGGNPEKALLYDADLFLSKPQSIAALRTHIEELLEQ